MSDQPQNPYVTPESNTDTSHEEEYAEVKVLSAKGRIGRLRLIAYAIGGQFRQQSRPRGGRGGRGRDG